MEKLKDVDILFLDPRSDDYSSLDKKASDPKFHAQVSWEQDGLEQASLIVMYFNHYSEASITLLEFGLFARDARMIVLCPEAYKHKGYVDMICARLGIQQVNTLDELSASILSRFSKSKQGMIP